MSNELTVIQGGGLGFLNNKSNIFRVKPATVELVQNMTKQEGAIPGKFRQTQTNQHFDSMHVVLLFEPVEQRSYMTPGEFSKEARLCFSLDGIKPHDDAVAPQAMLCERCPKSSWERYEAAKKAGKKGEDLSRTKPECDKYWHTFLLDRTTRSPYYFNFRKTLVKPFTNAMQSLAGIAAVARANGSNPNLFDFSFKMTPKKIPNTSYYGIHFSDFALMQEEDRAVFGGVYLDFINSRKTAAETEALAADDAIDVEVEEAPAQSATVGSTIEI